MVSILDQIASNIGYVKISSCYGTYSSPSNVIEHIFYRLGYIPFSKCVSTIPGSATPSVITSHVISPPSTQYPTIASTTPTITPSMPQSVSLAQWVKYRTGYDPTTGVDEFPPSCPSGYHIQGYGGAFICIKNGYTINDCNPYKHYGVCVAATCPNSNINGQPTAQSTSFMAYDICFPYNPSVKALMDWISLNNYYSGPQYKGSSVCNIPSTFNYYVPKKVISIYMSALEWASNNPNLCQNTTTSSTSSTSSTTSFPAGTVGRGLPPVSNATLEQIAEQSAQMTAPTQTNINNLRAYVYQKTGYYAPDCKLCHKVCTSQNNITQTCTTQCQIDNNTTEAVLKVCSQQGYNALPQPGGGYKCQSVAGAENFTQECAKELGITSVMVENNWDKYYPLIQQCVMQKIQNANPPANVKPVCPSGYYQLYSLDDLCYPSNPCIGTLLSFAGNYLFYTSGPYMRYVSGTPVQQYQQYMQSHNVPFNVQKIYLAAAQYFDQYR